MADANPWQETASVDVAQHAAKTQNVHGIPDTALLARLTDLPVTAQLPDGPKLGLHTGPFANNLQASTSAQQITDALAAVAQGTIKTGYVARADTVGGVRVRWMNVGADGASYGGSPGITNMRASIVLENGTVIRLTVGGANTWAVAAGAMIETDRVPASVWVPRRGDRFYVLAWVQPTTNGGIQATGAWNAVDLMASEWQGHQTLGIKTGGDYTDGSGGDTFAAQTTGWGFLPVSILADLQESHRTVCVVGDSISTTTFGDVTSWPIAPLNAAQSVPYVAGLRPGRATAGGKSAPALFAAAGCSDVICQLGANDGSGATRRAAWLALWSAYKANGAQRVYQTTMLPRTDGANAAMVPNTADALADNAWLRDGAPIQNNVPVATGTQGTTVLRAGSIGHPLTDYIEVGAMFFKADGSGLWDATYFAAGDGLHPNTAGYAVLQNVVDAVPHSGIDVRAVTKAIADWRAAQPPVLPTPSAGGATYHPNRSFSSQSQLAPVIQRCYMIPFIVRNQARDVPTAIYCNRTGGSGTPSSVRAVIYRAKPGTDQTDTSLVLPWDLVADYGLVDLVAGNSWSRATNVQKTRNLWPQLLPDWLHWLGICFEANSGTPMTILQGIAPTELQPGGGFSVNSGIAITLPAGAAPAQLTNGAYVGPIASAPYLLWSN